MRLSRQLKPGTEIFLDELPSGKRATARVANCVPLGAAGSNYWVVGIALDQPGNIWGIHPAPEDWGSETVAATNAAAQRLQPRLANGLSANFRIAESFIPADANNAAEFSALVSWS